MSQMDDDTEKTPKFHSESKWEEPWSDSPLSLFDLHREPRRVDMDPDERMRLPLKALKDFQCPICLGYMKKTSIVMECLHRFCGECIQKCLRLGRKECPKCRIHIPSRRSLRPDPKFDLLLYHILGNVEQLEHREDQHIEILNKAKNMNNAYAESRRRGILQQANQRKKKPSPPREIEVVPEVVLPELPEPIYPSPRIRNIEPSPLLEFLLRRHPQEDRLDRLVREVIRINGNATIAILKTFLSQKLSYTPSEHIQISALVGGKHIVLEDNAVLFYVQHDLCDVSPLDEWMVLQYRLRAPR